MHAAAFAFAWSILFFLMLASFVVVTSRIRRTTGAAYDEVPRPVWVAIWVLRVAFLLWLGTGIYIGARLWWLGGSAAVTMP